ncbi:MAG TPA: DUF1835 domain-containing protein [Ginsengibacter sp.]|nr:DUF1835 domain-containing protein [Ginsengibacter sp.]
MIHIVFQKNDTDILKKAIALDESMQGDIIQIADDFAIGPIKDIYSTEGIQNRKQWWRNVLAGGPYEGIVDDGSVADDNKTIGELIEKLKTNNEEVIWIWAAQNQHDVAGYYWLMSQLKEFQGRVFILYLNNLPFINEKGHIFYPTNIFEIQPKEFLKAKKLARPITLSEFEVDPDEWTKLCNENKGVRTLEGGKKLAQHDYDYYDNELMKLITPDWQKVNKLLHAFFSKSKVTTGDAYLISRIKQMIHENKIDAQGDIKNMKDFEVKLKVN